jgi:hypothetical protein
VHQKQLRRLSTPDEKSIALAASNAASDPTPISALFPKGLACCQKMPSLLKIGRTATLFLYTLTAINCFDSNVQIDRLS